LLDKKPEWIKKKVSFNNENIRIVTELLEKTNLNTVCKSAKCPNIYECFSKKTATFMILGNSCTRRCRFCGVEKSKPETLDEKEPENIAKAAKELGLKYIVVTSVTRDDLEDGGALQFVKVVRELKKNLPDSRIECLIPDFKGSIKDLRTVLNEDIFVLNHNVETVKRLYGQIRPIAEYQTSLNLLKNVKSIRKDVYSKSGFMLGLGETRDEISELLIDLKNHDVDIITIGQYLRPAKENIEVFKYYTPKEFEEIKEEAQRLNFLSVACDTFVRSSYLAADINAFKNFA